MNLDIKTDGQYRTCTETYYTLNCWQCKFRRKVSGVGVTPIYWEDLSIWGYDIKLCPECKKKTVITCKGDVAKKCDALGIPRDLTYWEREYYSNRMDDLNERLQPSELGTYDEMSRRDRA